MLTHPGFWVIVGIWAYTMISMSLVHKHLIQEREKLQTLKSTEDNKENQKDKQ